MSEIMQILSAARQNDPSVSERLLPLVYEELRALAASKLKHEYAGHSLQATALVHEAYLRLVQQTPEASWGGRGHFFSAASEAMRRVLVDRARRKLRIKHGGDREREPLVEDAIVAPEIDEDLLELDAALDKLEQKDRRKADLVKLRYFAGLKLKEAAEALGISPATADRDWAYARAWLYRCMSENTDHAKTDDV